MEPTTFAELGLSPKVLAAITDAGYTVPTPIQAQGIPVAMTGRDVLGIAQTGTGKTAAFVMPMISRLESGRARARMPRSLILAPTRELAAQVAQSFEKYGRNHKLAVALLIGGVSMDDQVAKLDRGVDVLIATPGRLLDHHGRGRVMLMGVDILVIDEADRMLDMGFIPDIEKIVKLLPAKRQTLFFSATMPNEITRLVDQFLNQPTRIEVAKPATAAKTITQRFLFCRDSEDWAKREALRELIRAQENIQNAIIFCNRKRDVAILLKSLQKHGFNAGALHGDMDQSSRTATLDKFRAGEITLLAASDVAARGLDIPEVSHVFNFDVPWQADDYVHRIGRTGRAGREGFAATLVAMEDVKAVREIEKLTTEPAVWIGEAPSEAELAEGASRKRRRGAAPASGRDDRRGGGRSRGGSERGDRPEQSDRGGRGRGEGRERDARPPRRDTPDDQRIMAADPAQTAGDAIVDAAAHPELTDARSRSRDRRRGGAARPPRTQKTTIAGPVAGEPVASGLGDQPVIEARPQRQDDAPSPGDRPRPERTRNERSRGERPRGDRPREARPRVEQPRVDRPGDDGPRESLPRESRPRESRPREDRPRQDSPRDARQRDEKPRDLPGRHGRSSEARPPSNDSDRRDRRPQRRDDSGPNVGFEDNIPAFLRRPVR